MLASAVQKLARKDTRFIINLIGGDIIYQLGG